MTELYLDVPQEEDADVTYDNAAAVLNSAVLMAEFEERSVQLRAAYPQYLDLRYGPGPRHRLDYFPASRPGPLVVFVHGGLCGKRSKESFSFLAAGPLAHGMHVAVVGSTLLPDRSLDGIADELRAAVSWLRQHAGNWGADIDRIIVAGWSGGAQLATLLLDEPGVQGGLAISGTYDLARVLHTCLNAQLKLCPHDLARVSPMHRPLSPRKLVLACGAAELAEVQRQTRDFAQARAGLPGEVLFLPERNHYTILNDLASPEGPLTEALRRTAGI